MGYSFLIVLLISIPIFYVYGIVAFIRNISRGGKSSPSTPSENLDDTLGVIQELKATVAKAPSKTVKEFIKDYEKRAKGDVKDIDLPVASGGYEHAKQKPHLAYEDILANWYKNNSVNLLLYIGAFLIVASAAIFVGFQWEAIPGVIKALLLSILTVGFFGFGSWFYTMPKIKNAGATFIAIAAVLVPVLGSAWYTFVFKDLGISGASVWMVTSAVAVLIYAALALNYKNAFYSYASTISTFSICISLVSVLNLNKDFYILAAIIANFILLATFSFLKNQNDIYTKMFSTPSKISSQVLMPFTLIYGLSVAVGSNKLFSLEAVLSLFLAAIFYYVYYKITKRVWQLALALAIIPFIFVLFFNWQKLPSIGLYFSLTILSLAYHLVAYLFLQVEKKKEEADVNLLYSILLSLFVIVFAWSSVSAGMLCVFILSPFLIGLATVIFLGKEKQYLYLSTLSLALLAYNLQLQVLKQPFDTLLFSFIPLGLLSYMGAYLYKKQKDLQQVFGVSTVVYLTLALISSLDNQRFLLSSLTIITCAFAAGAFLFENSKLSFGAAFSGLAALLVFMHLNVVPDYFYPIVILFFSYALYGISRMLPAKYAEEFRASSLAIATLTVIVYAVSTLSVGIVTTLVEKTALVASYLATALFGMDVWLKKEKNFGYITSIFAMATFLWQLKISGITDTLMYTASLGFYFIALAYTRKLKDDIDSQKVLDGIGLTLLLAPAFLLSFGDNPVKYSVFLGLIGILFTAVGISFAYKMYKYGGILGIVLAVLPQTYNFILALPRWVVIGGVGMLFIGTALFILLKRKEEK